MKDELISYIGLGSNLGGDSKSIVSRAIVALERWSSQPISFSSLWKSAPVDCPPGSPDFINAVVAIRPLPKSTPEDLLLRLQAIEIACGRTPKKLLNEARPLDLDILAWGDETRATPELTLPHPRAHLRRFVLAPWSEIAPEFVLPGQDLTVGQLLEQLTDSDRCERVELSSL